MAKNEPGPHDFELFLVKHEKLKRYWDGKGFNQKDKKKAVLCDYRLTKMLEWEHLDVVSKIVFADWRDDNSWAHLVPSCSAIK
jgi:hypothetical protein